MEYEDLIEDESEPPAEPLIGEDELEDLDPPARPPWKAFVLTGVLAGLIGAAVGGAGIYAALKTTAPEPVMQETVDLTPLESKIKRLTARVTQAEAKLAEPVNKPTSDLEPVDLTGVESRLQALETMPRPEIDSNALSALQAAQKDGFDWPDVSVLETRIAALENETNGETEAELPAEFLARLTAIEDRVEELREKSANAVSTGDILSTLEARLDALENRPPPEPVVERVSILAFPKASLIDALDESRSGNLIEKTLSRHIRVKDDNDPLTLIEGIESDLSAGRLAPAIEKFDLLPTPVKAAGQAWYESVKASL